MQSTVWVGAVANHLWQSTAFAAAAWGLTHLLRHQQARVRYIVWMSASLKFLVPFALLVSLGSEMRTVSRGIPSTRVITSTVMRATQPFQDEEMVAAPVSRVDIPKGGSMQPWLLCAAGMTWMLGSAFLIAVWSREWLQLYRTARVGMVAGRFGNVPVKISETIREPGVFGVWRPVLLLPAGMDKALSPEQMDAILAHEMEHVRRRDNLTAMLHMLVQAVFWFHPMLWWIRTRLMEEREMACDEAVLRSKVNPYTYAEGIVAVCRSYVEQPGNCAAGISGADLKRRLVHILRNDVTERPGRVQMVAMASLLAVVVMAPLAEGLMRVRAASVMADGQEKQAAKMESLPRMQFDVASVKLNTLGIPPYGPPPETNVDLDPGDIYSNTHGVLSIRNKSLRTLIAFAYKMDGDQQNYLKHHVPDFVLNDRFDVEARSENTNLSKDEMRAMMRSLLEDRFALKVHNETIQTNIYAMVQSVPGKFGPQIRVHPAEDTTCDKEPPPGRLEMPKDGFPPVCGVVIGIPSFQQPTETKFMISIGGRNVPLSLVAAALVAPYTGDTGLDRSVVDMTGVEQKVDFVLHLGYDEMEPTFTPNTAPWFPTELQEQLGLKLKSQKGPVNVCIVDHVERLKAE